MEHTNIVVGLVLICGLDAVFGETCYTGGTWWAPETEYCPYDCCGEKYSEYCCGVNVGGIVGGIIGTIIFVAVVIFVIKCMCHKKATPGHVIHPVGGATVIMSRQQGYAMAPQQYPPGNPAPGYGGNPAYPPPYPGNYNNGPPPPVQY